MSLHILHISDLHYGAKHAFEQYGHDDQRKPLHEVLGDTVRGQLGAAPLDAIVVSGDLFSDDQAYDADIARNNLGKLAEQFDLAPDRILCVPGNHDLSWRPEVSEPLRFYEETVEKIGARGTTFPHVVEIGARASNTKPVAFVLLDSCSLEGEKMRGIGRVGDVQLEAIREQLADRDISASSHHIIAMMHHHVLPVWPIHMVWNPLDPKGDEPTRVSMTADAGRIMNVLEDRGAIAILHGHQHRAETIRMRMGMSRPLHILAAPSVGAKAEDGEARGFFLYTLSDEALAVTEFRQSRLHGERFDRLPNAPTFCLKADTPPPTHQTGPICFIEDSTRLERITEASASDKSDLFYLFLDVVDCPQSRTLIRQALEAMTLPATEDYFYLGGMYDLLGRRDLAVRFRTNQPAHVRELIERTLEAGDQVQIDDGTLFTESECINVKFEGSTFEELLEPTAPAIRRVCLGSRDHYDDVRCQRGFINIDLPAPPSQRNRLIGELREALARHEGLADIIELVACAERALVFEIFMRCSQTSEIHRLNRVIEKPLSRYQVQKSTLLCYGFDEEPLGGTPPVLSPVAAG